METNLSCIDCTGKEDSIFQSVPSEWLENCFNGKKLLKFRQGEILIRKGEAFNGIFCIQTGAVKIIKPTPNGDTDFILWIARPSDIIGIDALINNEEHSYTAVAMKNVLACYIPAEDFKTLLRQNPSLALNVMKNLSQKINVIEERITGIVQKTVPNRFVDLIVNLSHKNGKTNGMYLEQSIDELAGIVGTTRTYLEKVIRSLRKKNLLTVHKKKILLLDLKNLNSYATGEPVENF